MKKHILITTLVSSILFSQSVFATDENKLNSAEKSHDLPTFQVEEISTPTVSKAVSPRISRRSLGQEAELILRIGTAGRPYDIIKGAFSPQVNDFRSLEAAMHRVLPHWRFEPAQDQNGNLIDVKVSLPVRVVKKTKDSKNYAAIALAKPTILASANH